MQFRYPRSFFKLLAIGFLLAVLPLTAGLLAMTVAIQKLSTHSQQAVFDAARIAHSSRQLAETLPALERAARQSQILHDPSFLAGYGELRDDFARVIAQMRTMPLDVEMSTLLDQMVAQEAATYQLQTKNKQTSTQFAQLEVTGRKMLAHSSAVIDNEADALRAQAEEAEAGARMQMLVVIPVALIVVAGFTYLLARPIAQIEAGILGLGERRLNEPVVVEGPENLVKVGEQLNWLRERLQQLEQQKAQFLRHVSHELKTPLTALREGSELLAEGTAGALQPRQQEIVGIVRDNSIHLQRLIEELLRHGEEEFRAMRVESVEFSLPDLVDDISLRHGIAMDARGLRLEQKVAAVRVKTDAGRVRVILDNLLSNAIKHAPANSVVELFAHVENRRLVLRVLDAGPGVPPEARERVFEPFWRGATPAGSKVKSTGLGLSICRDHARALGGEISIGEPIEGRNRGDFRVVLPVEGFA
ncbi:MAG TPA: ATP-binding protein [Rhodocyclaceae bacterium]|jgi:two-component system sensor histidine kinase GlrK|nr:ATP-binding protein [Rhodocyclaceae bacterium]